MIKTIVVLLTISVTFVHNVDLNEVIHGADQIKDILLRKRAVERQLATTKQQLAICLRNRRPTENDGQNARITRLEDENLRLRKENNELKYELEYNVKYVKKLQQDLSSQSSNQCQRQTKNLENKIIKLQEDNSRRAKQNKFQLFGRIKNYLSGSGPYSQEQQREFSNFKQKILNLERTYNDKLSQIQRINKEKEDIQLQQKYCTAQLSDFNQQIVDLEKIAESKGKSYYLKEIKRLADKRFASYCDSKQETGNIMIRSLQKQIQELESKLNKVSALKDKFESEKERAQKKTKECEQDLERIKRSDTGSQSQKSKLSQQNNELRKLIKDIYSIKNK